MKLTLVGSGIGKNSDGIHYRRRLDGTWERDDTAAVPRARKSAAPSRPGLAARMTPDQLVEAHYMFALAIAAKQIARLPSEAGIDTDALRGAALEALVKASRRFEPDRMSRFSTYAATRIIGAIKDELRVQDPNTRGARARGEAQPKPLSFELPLQGHEEWEGVTLGATIAGGANTEQEAVNVLGIRAGLDAMTDRERVIAVRSLSGETLRSIGADFGVTESRVSQIAEQGLARARTPIGPRRDG